MILFAQSTKDIYLIGLSFLEIAIIAYSILSFGYISISFTLGLGALLIFMICTNYQCIAHNFLHNPFFTSKTLNNIFSVTNTLGLGMCQSLYRAHHLNHHKYNNDIKNPITGTTQDRTSTYRFSKRFGKEENILSYAFLGFFRSDLKLLFMETKMQGLFGLFLIESGALVAFILILCVWNWQGVLLFFIPVWYLGQCAALAENYLEHHGAISGNRLTDSVSCYNIFYNFIWFNNGYHQEHHYSPQVHWTKIPEVKSKMLSISERRVVRGAHWFNFMFLSPLFRV